MIETLVHFNNGADVASAAPEDHDKSDPRTGLENSGRGRKKGIEALHHYTQLKCVTIRL